MCTSHGLGAVGVAGSRAGSRGARGPSQQLWAGRPGACARALPPSLLAQFGGKRPQVSRRGRCEEWASGRCRWVKAPRRARVAQQGGGDLDNDPHPLLCPTSRGSQGLPGHQRLFPPWAVLRVQGSAVSQEELLAPYVCVSVCSREGGSRASSQPLPSHLNRLFPF